MKYVIYTRVSKKIQEESGLSLEAQEKDCVGHCKGKPYVVFRDGNSSAGRKIEQRKVLLEALDSLEKDDVLLCSKPDRLARSEDIGAIKYLVRLENAKIEYVDGGKADLDDPESMMMEGMKNLFAAWERSQISRRTQRAFREKKSKGERWGNPAYGLMLDHSTTRTRKLKDGSEETKSFQLIPNPDEQRILARMVELHLAGKSYQIMSEVLTKEGKFNRNGKPFQPMSLWKIIKSQNLSKENLCDRVAA